MALAKSWGDSADTVVAGRVEIPLRALGVATAGIPRLRASIVFIETPDPSVTGIAIVNRQNIWDS